MNNICYNDLLLRDLKCLRIIYLNLNYFFVMLDFFKFSVYCSVWYVLGML